MIDVANFQAEVLDASHEQPVLVDFWAPWCGPCRQLGPILEKLSAEENAGFVLAKLNTDQDQATAARYGIRSIPAVKLFVDGEVVDEFIGALPEPQVRAWLQRAIPSETRRLVSEARAALEAGAGEDAEARLEEALALEPTNAEAALLLAKRIVFRDPARAEQLSRTPDAAFDEVQSVQRVAALLTHGAPDDLPESPARDALRQGIAELQAGNVEGAMAALLESVRVQRDYQDDMARKTLLALFTLLGDRDELTRQYRRALERALF
jgi:putative thioredoxin